MGQQIDVKKLLFFFNFFYLLYNHSHRQISITAIVDVVIFILINTS